MEIGKQIELWMALFGYCSLWNAKLGIQE